MSEIELLENMIKKIQKEQEDKYNGSKVLGFTLSLHKDGNGRPQWRAHKYYDGKTANIYVGKDATKAEEKIKNWVKKHPHFQPYLESNLQSK